MRQVLTRILSRFFGVWIRLNYDTDERQRGRKTKSRDLSHTPLDPDLSRPKKQIGAAEGLFDSLKKLVPAHGWEFIF